MMVTDIIPNAHRNKEVHLEEQGDIKSLGWVSEMLKLSIRKLSYCDSNVIIVDKDWLNKKIPHWHINLFWKKKKIPP